MPSPPLTWHVDVRDRLTIVTVTGTIDPQSGSALYHALVHCWTREPDAVVVDLSDAVVTDLQAARTVTRIAEHSARWPGTPVLFRVPDPSTAGTLTEHSGPSPAVLSTVADAVSTLTAHHDAVSELLHPVPGTARRARDVVTDTCLRWGLSHLIAHATLAVSELVTNAVMHAHTVMTLQVSLRPQYLYIAVFDGVPAPVVPARSVPGTDAPGGRGLHLVERVSARWGCHQHDDGKVVWASFATSPST